MSEGRHGPGCADILFRRHAPAGGEVALEDYARALTGATSARALPAEGGAGAIRGVHLCGLAASLAPGADADVEAFARELAERSGGGLGWS